MKMDQFWTINCCFAYKITIIDLANGKQPMKSKNGNTIIFNGEIVNFRELRNQLINDGENFSTNSDTGHIKTL